MPLKLRWEPWYSVPDGEEVCVGMRVRVRLAGHEYIAVVSSVGGSPDISLNKIQQILQVEEGLEPVLSSEIRFWRFISDYYLCTIGEVYKSVYPAGRTSTEERKSRVKSVDEPSTCGRRALSKAHKQALIQILDAFTEHQTVLLQGVGREPVYEELTRRTLESGQDVLLLRPTATKPSFVRIRELSRAVRSATPTLVEGHRSNIFLPFTKLGLIIVDEEQSQAYKQDPIAPRYQTRDAALALASQLGARVLLGSATPSLETIYNVAGGKFVSVSLFTEQTTSTPEHLEIIDTSAEARKNGMIGDLSRRMLRIVSAAHDSKQRVLVLSPWNNFSQTEYQFRQQLRDNRFKFCPLNKSQSLEMDRYSVVVLMNTEALLSKDDFRADERAFRVLRTLLLRTRGHLVLQTKSAAHPVFGALLEGRSDISAQLLSERQDFGYPPYSRMVEVRLTDSNEARLTKMTRELTRTLGGSLQFFLPKDRSLNSTKRHIYDEVCAFEDSHHYVGHIVIDVDP